MCHDEPRESSKGAKHEPPEIGSGAKQEEPLPYMLGPSLDQRQADQQLKEVDPTLASGTVREEANPAQLLQQCSNPTSQGQVFANNNPQCKRDSQVFIALNLRLNHKFPATMIGTLELKINSRTCIVCIHHTCSMRLT